MAANVADPYLSFLRHERSRGTQFIRMNDRGEVIFPPYARGQIATAGLVGCTAVASVLEEEDGTQRAYIQHYNPRNAELAADTLFQYLLSAEETGRVTRATTVIMTPGAIGEPGEKIDSALPVELRDIAKRVRLLGGLEGDERIHPYETWRTFKIYGAGSLMIEATPGQSAAILADLEVVDIDLACVDL